MRVSEIGRLCLFGRREWKTGCGQDVVVKTNEERRMPLHVCVRSRKNILRTKERVVFDSKLNDKRIDYTFSIL